MDLNKIREKIEEYMIDGLELKGMALVSQKNAKEVENKCIALLEILADEVGIENMDVELENLTKKTLERVMTSESLKNIGVVPNNEDEANELGKILANSIKIKKVVK